MPNPAIGGHTSLLVTSHPFYWTPPKWGWWIITSAPTLQLTRGPKSFIIFWVLVKFQAIFIWFFQSMLRLILQLWHSFSNIPLLNCPYCSQLHVPVLHSIPSPPGLNVHIHLIIPSLTFSHRPCISFPDILHQLLLQSRTTHSYLLHFHMYSAFSQHHTL